MYTKTIQVQHATGNLIVKCKKYEDIEGGKYSYKVIRPLSAEPLKSDRVTPGDSAKVQGTVMKAAGW